MDTEITTMELQFRKERDEMFYRERAVDQALTLMKRGVLTEEVEDLLHNANVIYNFIKGKSNESEKRTSPNRKEYQPIRSHLSEES